MRRNKKNMQQAQEPAFMAKRRLILNENSSFSVREAYRTLRTNIRFALRSEGCKSFCITSSAPAEGKSITIVNLAITIAESGQKVLLIDADLRKPALARLLMEEAAPGLSDVLAGLATPEKALHKEVYTNLDVLLSGSVPPNASELLGSDRMQQLIQRFAGEYDYILVDTPPVNVVSDVCLVADVLDGVLILVRQGKTRKDDFKRTISNLELTNTRILGCVFNGVPNDLKYEYSYEK